MGNVQERIPHFFLRHVQQGQVSDNPGLDMCLLPAYAHCQPPGAPFPAAGMSFEGRTQLSRGFTRSGKEQQLPAPLHVFMKPLVCMLIDDDQEECEIFNFATEALKFPVQCVQAANGADAIAILSKGGFLPDYIFLDLYMPRMDGRECLQHLKRLPSLDGVPVIVYSTGLTEFQKGEMASLGADGFLEKAANIPDLSSELESFFASRRAELLARA
jgi:CheY-like chemotaxis protein